MINVSSEFKEIMMQRQDFKENAEVTFSDGTVLNLEEKDFSITNNSVVDSADANTVPIGAAICRNIQFELLNDDHLEKYDFYGAKVRLYLTFELSNTVEKIEFGTFTVTEPESYGTTVVVNAADDMYKANAAYSTDISFPATAGTVLRDACSRCNILMGTTSFLHDDFKIQTKPSGDYTFRQVIGYIAMIACGNARISQSGKLEIMTYDLDFSRECHNLTEWKSLTMDTSDITITGIQTTRKVKKTEGENETEVEETVRAGSEGYMLTVSNPLVSGNEETLVSWIHEKISGVPFRKFAGDYITYPLAEFMDLAKITDWRGNTYNTFVTDIGFVFFGITTLKNSAESGLRNAAKYGSEDTRTNVHLQELIEQERTDRKEAIKKLGDSLNAGGGLYATYKKQPDGSTITYLHDKPTLKESKTVIKITAEAIGVSNDGGKNYLYGFVLDGDIIAKILYAHGIDADYIDTGAIIVRDAETKEIIFSADMDTGRVVISGDVIQIGGRPIGQVLEDVKDHADKNLADYADSVSKDLSSLQSQVDGQVEDWYYDYEPSMQNYPASGWTTTEERRKHIGDRFFWKSKGYAYRFMEDNGIWGWILLQDTDITKAMQVAMEAQDTADGKRRVFVTMPQPPYDIGDLWANGEDILTATVARDKGSVYVSSDWQKLNHYTDDTVANQALEEARKAHNIVMQLDNEYQGIPADWQGNITAFPTVQTTAQVFYGQQDVSASCSYSTNKSSGITGSWNNYLRTYTVTALSTDTGWIDITANYLGIFDVTKRFNVSKNKDGKPGENGSDGVGITKITEYFAISTSSTYAPSNWYTTPQQTTETYRYLWNYERIHYSDGQSLDTEKRIIGVHGISGSNGSDGKGIRNVTNYYLATSQQNGVTTSTSGWTTTPQTTTDVKKYLWNYEVITYTDNTTLTVTPHIIGTHGENGEDGQPGRTYFIELSLQAFKRGQDGLLTPDEITARGYYREGDSPDKHSYTGRFQLQASTDGKTYTTISSSSTDVSGQRFTQLNTVSKNYIFFRVNFYHPGGFTNLIDYQTIPVLIDIAALSKDDILDLITDNGKWQGFYKGPDGNVYISFGAARGGLMKLGGVNNGNGRQEIYDNRGNLIGRLDNTGLTFYYKYSQQGQGYSYTGITLNKDGLIYVEGSYTGDVYIDTVYEYVLSFDSTQTGVDGDFKNLDAAKATIASAVLNNITKMLVSGDATFSSKPKFNNGLNVADGNVQFPGWKFNGRFLESTDGHVKIRDKDGIARLESGNFQIMYGLDLYLAGQSGSGDFGDGGNPFNIYGLGTAVGSNLVINGNSVYRSSSSKRYKTIGRNVSEEDIEKWYQIQPVWAKYKNDYVNRNSSCFNKVMPMLIAEDVETYLPTAAVKNEEGLTDDWSERILIPAMFAMIKSQKEQIDAMKKDIEEIKRLQNNQEVRKKW